MPKRKEAQKNDENNEIKKGLFDLWDEIRKLQKKEKREDMTQEEVMQIILDKVPFESEVKKLKIEVGQFKEKLEDIRTFMFEHATGARPFFNQQIIKDTMLEDCTAEHWKGRSVEDLPGALATI